MILIVGGAYQGKEIFAKEQFLEIIWTDGKDCDMEEVFSAQGILNFHEYIDERKAGYFESGGNAYGKESSDRCR